ncbi:hypothetical protein F4678DRAFT_462442 [Xylaria arbuscula]|nr:hypothetical protein F4678DRAFT_462442 [Xylaria arbuscula]
MLFSCLFIAATWLSGITASSTPELVEPSENHAEITVAVGKGSFTFNPNTITANPGDEIVFEFWSDSHSVARSEFGFPCMPYEDIVPDGTGFWSGDVVNADTSQRPRFTFTVNDTEPIFFYCSVQNSCKGNKMIGVINPNSTWTLEKQDSFINPTILELQPGDPLPSESNGTDSGSEDHQDRYDVPNLSIGEVTGIIISSVAMLLLIAILAYTCRRQGRLERDLQQRNSNPNPHGLPFIDVSSPQESENSALQSPSPKAHSFYVPAQTPNSGHWSLNSSLTSPRRSSFPAVRPGVVSDVPSEASVGQYIEQQRLEVPGSPVLPVELPAGNEHHISKTS